MKRNIGVVALLLLLSFSFCSTVEEAVLTKLFQNYLNAQQALADDDYEGANSALAALAEEADGELKESAGSAASAESIEDTRRHFKMLSEEVAKLELPSDLVVAFCPMADDGNGAHWVQKDGEVANPYFGESMRRCGTIQDKSPAGNQ